MSDNTNNNDHFEELCAGYVLSALDAEEQQEFESMLQQANEEQKKLYYELHATATQLAFAAEKQEPSARVKQALMDKVRADSAPTAEVTSIQTQEKNWPVMAVAASIALFLLVLALVFYAFNLNSEIGRKQATINKQDTQIAQLKDDANHKEELLSVLSAPKVEVVALSGLQVNPDGFGKVIWDPEKRQALLQVSNLPAVPSDKDYELWLIKDNKPIAAGVFAVTNSGKSSFFKIDQLAEATKKNANAFAVTLEPKGGVPQPTGDMYLLGNIQ